jgi:hypothetical protein
VSALTYEVRNTRNVLIRTFGDAKAAINWAKAHSDVLTGSKDGLAAYAVETIRRERLLTDEPEITTARQIKRRAS